ncbi:MAG: hypothetical protein QXU95_00250 [Candidatus Bathyarchaeia archaeon]
MFPPSIIIKIKELASYYYIKIVKVTEEVTSPILYIVPFKLSAIIHGPRE